MNVKCAHVGGLWKDGASDYYDGFKPCEDKAVTCQIPGGGTGVTIQVEFIFDDYPQDVSWTLYNTCGTKKEVFSGGGYAADATSSIESKCVEDGTFEFTVKDGYGDGICCSNGSKGDYTVRKNGVEMISMPDNY